MSLIKDKDEQTEDFIIQKDTTTKSTALVIAIILIVLVVGVIVSGLYFK